jgi:hypothetical protein
MRIGRGCIKKDIHQWVLELHRLIFFGNCDVFCIGELWLFLDQMDFVGSDVRVGLLDRQINCVTGEHDDNGNVEADRIQGWKQRHDNLAEHSWVTDSKVTGFSRNVDVRQSRGAIIGEIAKAKGKAKVGMDQWTCVPQEKANNTQNLGNRRRYFSIQGFSSVLITFYGMKWQSPEGPIENRLLGHGNFGRVSSHTVALSTIFSRHLIFWLLLFWLEQGHNARSIIPSAWSCLSVYTGFMRQFEFRRAYLSVPPMDHKT